MNRLQKLTHPLLLALTLLALVAAGCGGADGSDEARDDTGEPATRSVRVETLVLEPTTFEDVIQITGTVKSSNDATLSAQSSGTLDYLAPLGRTVAQGAAVARVDAGLANAALQQTEAQVAAAQAQFELAEDNLKRQEPLYQDSVISALEFQNVKAQYNQAKAGLEQAKAVSTQARKQVSNTTINAPFSGTVEEHFAEQGEQVNPGMQVLRVVNTGSVKVEVGVPERYAGDVEVGTPVEINFKAYRGETRRGRVSFSGSAINPQSRAFPIEVEVSNTDRKLKPQMIAEVFVTLETLPNVLIVPQAAIVRDEEGNSVFVVETEGGQSVASRRRVTLGPTYAGRVVVESGLEAGDEVLVLGQTNVTEGDAVEVVEQYRNLDAAGVPFKAGTDTVE
jgi:membrane fusion protein (multidrug efflux system)